MCVDEIFDSFSENYAVDWLSPILKHRENPAVGSVSGHFYAVEAYIDAHL